LTRRDFLKASAGGLLLPAVQQRPVAREALHNGIVLPAPWPPERLELTEPLHPPPYLVDPPAIINIDVGRQLFVDDFLIQESSLYRTFHQATYHPSNPIFAPERPWEHEDPHAKLTGLTPSPSAMPFSDGVFYDPADRLFKMWYMAGYQQHTALAVSRDGVSWERPRFNVRPGTNIVLSQPRDSNTVWLDLDTDTPDERYKMAVFLMAGRAVRLFTSADGIHWREGRAPGPSGDRSTAFLNPFRKKWVFSLRAEDAAGLHRYRRYAEAPQFTSARWDQGGTVLWTGADRRDMMRPEVGAPPELYNLDAVAYESIVLGLFTIFRGERENREKPNDICLGFSRDGFHWARPWRAPLIGVSDRGGDWNWANVQSAGGCCLVVGDRLFFYVSGRTGVAGTSLPGTCSTGLATLRRDGFASVSDEWPTGVVRPIGHAPPGTLTTRPLHFTGTHLFVNAAVAGELRVDVLSEEGRVIQPYTAEQCVPVAGDSTKHRIAWKDGATLARLAGQPVRFRFALVRARLYAFWVSPSPQGGSRGYVAAGGPGFAGTRDMS
jgi:hypothetical protein